MRSIDVRAERIAALRAELSTVRTLLLAPTPQNLTACSQPVSEAADILRRLTRADADHESVLGLKRDLEEIRLLLEQAGAFYLDWTSVLNSRTGSYDATGDLHAPGGATVSVDG